MKIKILQHVTIPAPAPYAAYGKREAEPEADADAQFLGYPAHAVAHSVTATVKHACREVTTQHCVSGDISPASPALLHHHHLPSFQVDNPKIKLVPVEVEHCHTVTKVDCAPVENPIPTTKCEAVETTHVSSPYAAYAGYY